MHQSHTLQKSSYQKGVVYITQKQTGATLAVKHVLTVTWFAIPFTLYSRSPQNCYNPPYLSRGL